MLNVIDRVKMSNKVFPYFTGLSSDLLFFTAINTLFLTVVKHCTAAEISSFITLSTIVTILCQFFIFQIVKRIGNVKSVRLGAVILFCSSLVITFSNSYFLILFGYILYEISFLFLTMDNIILRKNLKFLNESERYLEYRSKGTMIYSIVTMIISFFAGFLFNMNYYIPMFICIFFCIVNIILSLFLYEVDIEDVHECSSKKMPMTKMLFCIFFLFGIGYAVIDLGQSNGKLLIQYELFEFLKTNAVAIYLSFIIAISRVVRVLGNLIFKKYYQRLKEKVAYYIGFCLSLSMFFMLIGGMIPNHSFKIWLMSLGFFLILFVRDPFQNYMNDLLLTNCNEQYHQIALLHLNISRKLGKFMLGMVITSILLKFEMKYVIFFLLIVSLLQFYIIQKIYQMTQSKQGDTI